jgi:hypothetical protein
VAQSTELEGISLQAGQTITGGAGLYVEPDEQRPIRLSLDIGHIAHHHLADMWWGWRLTPSENNPAEA